MSPRSIAFAVALDMLSDWSVGSGGGRQGSLDSVVERDADGLPFVPASTLHGIWRDAAEQVAFGLDDGSKGRWCALVDHLFGSHPAIDQRGADGGTPIPGRLDVADLHLPPGLRAALVLDPATRVRLQKARRLRPALRAKQRLRDALAIVKPGVKIDERSGRAKTDYLRFEEAVRSDARLRSRCSIALPQDAAAAAALVCLAFAATRLVERIGANRRRGAGRCRMSIAEVDAAPGLPGGVDVAISELERIKTPPLPELLTPVALDTQFASGEMDEFADFPLDVVIETPTVVAADVLGNIVTTLDHIPGTMLLAGVASILEQAGVDRSRIGPALANGGIRVLPAFPEVARRRGVPIPLVIDRQKDNDGGPDRKGLLLNTLVAEDRRAKQDTEAYKPVGRGYLAFDRTGERPHLAMAETRLVTRTHNAVEDGWQKPTEAVVGVYSYEAIASGTRLKSVVRVRRSLLGGATPEGVGPAIVRIGRKKKAGYGSVRLSLRSPERSELSRFPDDSCTRTVLYLASDILLPSSVAVADASPRAFLCAAVRAATGSEARVVDGVIWTGRTDGWLARWGLPRPSYVVIRAGSTVAIEAANGGRFTAAALRQLAREGLGLRRAEGFGDLLVDPAFATTALKDSVRLARRADSPAPTARQPIEDECRDFAMRIEDAALRALIDAGAERAVTDGKWKALGWAEDKPNMSQLGALRSAMGQMRGEDDLKSARDFVARVGRTDRRSRWGEGEGPEHALAVLEALFSEPDAIWSRLDVAEEELAGLLIIRSAADARRDLRCHAIARFMHAAMRARKRDLERPAAA